MEMAAVGAAGPKAMRRMALPSSTVSSCGGLAPAVSRLRSAACQVSAAGSRSRKPWQHSGCLPSAQFSKVEVDSDCVRVLVELRLYAC